ncbi:hypothetical protein H206_03710 [Candidatus Electrothrix aarhusensis]|uniref:Secreted protein n=1 Tax=Candidatus Electrothrix aarhusensis TaxID=1859131 RepID=A0A444J192_9BACT|nr:hypothetical protein H206_03710 [Candidatus Electrothrix aarhusensis]
MKTLTEEFFPAQLVALFAAVLCLLLFSTAQAAPNRNWSPQPTSQPQATAGTCNARYEVVVTHVNNRPMNKVISFGDFQSHGQGRRPIKPPSVPNRPLNAVCRPNGTAGKAG